MADNFSQKTTIEADVMTPANLWRACQNLTDDEYPVLVTMGGGEGVHLHEPRDARLFGLGVHFGSMAQAEMEAAAG